MCVADGTFFKSIGSWCEEEFQVRKTNIEYNLADGLLNWYPWTSGARICFVGNCPTELKQDVLCRGVVESNNPPYDYMIAFHALEEIQNPSKRLENLRDDLKSNGHLFLVCENRLSLRNFVGDKDPYTGQIFDGIDNYRNYTSIDNSELEGRCYARYEIEAFLKVAGFTNYRGCSILPGLEMPQQIYAWDYLPEENLAIRYTPLYHNPSSVFMDEAKLYESIMHNGMFHQMANAYLIDCTIDGEFYEINHVTTSMDRGITNATATIIQKDGQVIKKALYPEGNERIRKLFQNMQDLKERGIVTVEHREQTAGTFDGQEVLAVSMPYIKAPTALEYLRGLIFRDKEFFVTEMSRFLDTILMSSEEVNNNSDGITELGATYQKVYIDLVPLNCFVVDGEFVFYDQEFCEENYPINVVLLRAIDIIYMGDKQMEEIVPESFFLNKYNLTDKVNAYRAKGHNYIEKLRNRDTLAEFNAAHMVDATAINANRQRMNFSIQEYNKLFMNLMNNTENKQIFIFGSGQWARKFVAEFGEVLSINAMLDNQEENQGKVIAGIHVMSPDVLKNLHPDEYKVYVCVKYYTSIIKQLEKLGCTHYGIYDPYLERPETICSIVLPKQIGQEAVSESSKKPYHIGYVAGVFDLFHIGHLNILKRAKEQCDYLIVGVVSDEQASKGKARAPYVGEQERKLMVEACKYVDEAFILPIAASGTRDVYRKYHFDAQFSGSDYEHDPTWRAEQAWLRERGSDIVFFPYTESISSTKLKAVIEKDAKEKK